MNRSVIESLDVCVQAVKIGQSRGAFTLEQASKLVEYVDVLIKIHTSLIKNEPVDMKNSVTAYEVIRSAIELAQSKGAYLLADVPKILGAIRTLDGAKHILNGGAAPASVGAQAPAPVDTGASLKGKEKLEQ